MQRTLSYFLALWGFSLGMLPAQPLLKIVDLATIPDPIVSGQSYPLELKVVNVGDEPLTGVQIGLKFSVNHDNATPLGGLQIATLKPIEDTLTISIPNYQFESSRFSGGGANDIIVWPTVAVPSGIDTIVKNVVFIDAAAFRVNNTTVSGVGASLSYYGQYSVVVKTQNVGININEAPILFFVRLDDFPPVLVQELDKNIEVGDMGSAEIQSFSLSALYPNVNPNVGLHHVSIWAEEKGKANAVAKGVFPITSATFPVALTYYDAISFPAANAIRVVWETEQETNNAEFVVEKFNYTTSHFDRLADLPAHGAHLIYEIVDDRPSLNLNTYRLLQIDVDGTTRILGTQSVNYQTPEVIKLLNVYPIPMQEVLNIDVFVGTGDATLIQLYDIKGDLVREEKKYTSTGTQTFSLHVEDLPRGVYCYKVSNPLTLIIGKVIKE